MIPSAKYIHSSAELIMARPHIDSVFLQMVFDSKFDLSSAFQDHLLLKQISMDSLSLADANHT